MYNKIDMILNEAIIYFETTLCTVYSVLYFVGKCGNPLQHTIFTDTQTDEDYHFSSFCFLILFAFGALYDGTIKFRTTELKI